MTPLIGVDGKNQMDIQQNVDDIIDKVTIDGNPRPVIGRREATSFVSVADRETIILGGLHSSSRRASEARWGILGQIPLIGPIFGSRSYEETRTELLVFPRPTVITDTAAHRDAQQQIDQHTQRDGIIEALQNPPSNQISPDSTQLPPQRQEPGEERANRLPTQRIRRPSRPSGA